MANFRMAAVLGLMVVLSACSQAPRVAAKVAVPAAEVVPTARQTILPAEVATKAVAVERLQIKAGQSKPGSEPGSSGSYRIGVDDVVKISVWRNPELSVEVPVRPDGFVSAPLIGDVQAGGLTATEVAANIESKLEQYIRQPKVSVILTDLVSHQFLSRVRVTGAVNQPISLPYRQGMTVLDLVLEAGGLSDFAVPARARLYRKEAESGEVSSLKVRLDKIIKKGELGTNVELKAGDVLTIPERRF